MNRLPALCRVQSGVATAIVLCHRYFACKSMRQNDCFVRLVTIPLAHVQAQKGEEDLGTIPYPS